jgi:hypothetical protein
MPKYWVKRVGATDDEAFGVPLEAGADVSDLLQSAVAIFDFGACKPAELRVVLGGAVLSNRKCIDGLNDVTFTIEPKEGAEAKFHAVVSADDLSRPTNRSPVQPSSSSSPAKRSGNVATRPASQAPPLPVPVTAAAPIRTANNTTKSEVPKTRGLISKPAVPLATPSRTRSASPTTAARGVPQSRARSPGGKPQAAETPVKDSSTVSTSAGSPGANRAPPPIHKHETCGKFEPSWGSQTTCAKCKQHRSMHSTTGKPSNARHVDPTAAPDAARGQQPSLAPKRDLSQRRNSTSSATAGPADRKVVAAAPRSGPVPAPAASRVARPVSAGNTSGSSSLRASSTASNTRGESATVARRAPSADRTKSAAPKPAAKSTVRKPVAAPVSQPAAQAESAPEPTVAQSAPEAAVDKNSSHPPVDAASGNAAGDEASQPAEGVDTAAEPVALPITDEPSNTEATQVTDAAPAVDTQVSSPTAGNDGGSEASPTQQ